MALVEAFLVMRGSWGAKVSDYTLMSYRQGLSTFLAWSVPVGMQLLRPRRNDGFAYARHLETGGLAPGSVKVRLAAARALFAALRWAGATDVYRPRPGRQLGKAQAVLRGGHPGATSSGRSPAGGDGAAGRALRPAGG